MMQTASAAIIRDKKVLLVKRIKSAQFFPEHWAFPGGRAESGESPGETVIREVKEETNLDFIPSQIFMKGRYHDRQMFRFTGEWSGNIELQEEELTDYGWFTCNEALKLKLAFDYENVIGTLCKMHLIE